MQSKFTKDEWFSIVSIPFALDAIFTNGANFEQKLIFQSDVTNWNSHQCPLYKSVCKYFSNEKSWERYARKSSEKIVGASFEKFLEGFVPTARNALDSNLSEKEKSVFFGHILFFAFRHGMQAGTGIPYGSDEKKMFLNNYLGGFVAPKGTTNELEKLLESNFG